MQNKIMIQAQLRPFNKAVELLIMNNNAPGRIIFEEVEEGNILDPTATIDAEAVQTLIDDLWRCGCRPSEGTGSAGALAATQAHLKDMRKIANETLEVIIDKAKVK